MYLIRMAVEIISNCGKYFEWIMEKPHRLRKRDEAALRTSAEWRRGKLFRVWNDIEQEVRVSPDREVEAPTTTHAALPNVAAFVVFLRSQGRVAEVLRE